MSGPERPRAAVAAHATVAVRAGEHGAGRRHDADDAEVEHDAAALVEERAEAHPAAARRELDVRHPPSDQQVPVAEVVPDVEPLRVRRCASVAPPAAARDLREPPAEIDGVLRAEVEALSAGVIAPLEDRDTSGMDWPAPLTIEEVAAELRCSEDEVRALIREGELQTVACGVRPGLVPRHRLDHYLRRGGRRLDDPTGAESA